MGRYIEQVWPGNPSGATRAERTACRFRAYVPELLVGAKFVLAASARGECGQADQPGTEKPRIEAVGIFEAFTGFERVRASPDSETHLSPPTCPVPARPHP